MKVPARALSVNRVWIALGQGSGDLAALEVESGMAAVLRAELAGLFVEDINLLRLGGLPFAGETGAASAIWRRWEAGDLERAMRIQTAQLERLLVKAAEQAQVHWSFQTARGRVLQEAFAVSCEAEAVVFAHANPAHALPPISRPVAAGRAGAVKPPFLVVFDASTVAFRALGVARDLAQQAGAGLHVLIPAEDVVRFARMRDEASDWLNERGSKAAYHGLSRFDAAALAETARNRASGVLLLPAQFPAAELSVLSTLLAQILCPLVLVR